MPFSSVLSRPAAAAVATTEFPKNKKDTVRVSLTEYQGNERVDIRAYDPTADGMKGGKGINLQRSQIVTLRKALAGGYHYHRLKVSGDARFHDTPAKDEHSHVADALQYALLAGGEGRALTRRRDLIRPAYSLMGSAGGCD